MCFLPIPMLPPSRTASLLVVLAACLLLVAAWMPQTNARAQAEVDAGLQRALASFAAARALGGLLAVAMSAQVSATPGGVGITGSPAQTLKPLADLVQTFGDVMLAASVAFGIQKLLLALGGHAWANAALTVTALAWVALRLGGMRAQPAARRLAPLLVALAVLRFAVPLVALVGHGAWHVVMASEYQAAQAQVEGERRPVPVTATPLPAADGFVDRLLEGPRRWLEQLLQKQPLALPSYEALRDRTAAAVDGMVRLLALFVLQTVLLPLATLWLLWRALVALLRAPRPA